MARYSRSYRRQKCIKKLSPEVDGIFTTILQVGKIRFSPQSRLELEYVLTNCSRVEVTFNLKIGKGKWNFRRPINLKSLQLIIISEKNFWSDLFAFIVQRRNSSECLSNIELAFDSNKVEAVISGSGIPSCVELISWSTIEWSDKWYAEENVAVAKKEFVETLCDILERDIVHKIDKIALKTFTRQIT